MGLFIALLVLAVVALLVLAFFFHARFVALLKRLEALLVTLEKIGSPAVLVDPATGSVTPIAPAAASFTGSAE